MGRVVAVTSALAIFAGLAARAQLAGAFSPSSGMRRNLGMSTSGTSCADDADAACVADSTCKACKEVFIASVQTCGGSDYDSSFDGSYDSSYEFSFDYDFASCNEIQDTFCCAMEAVEEVNGCATNDLWLATYGR